MEAIETGEAASGLRWARAGQWRIMAYAGPGGGYCRQHRLGLAWCLLHEGEPMDVERALTAALGLQVAEKQQGETMIVPDGVTVDRPVSPLKAWALGALSWLAGEALTDDPYPPGSELSQRWQAGWQDARDSAG